MIEFTRFVGTSPGTTTMEIAGLNGLSVCPPFYFNSDVNAPLPGAPLPPSTSVTLNPYGDDTKLSGLRGARWDLALLGFGLAFAGVLGYAFLKRKK